MWTRRVRGERIGVRARWVNGDGGIPGAGPGGQT